MDSEREFGKATNLISLIENEIAKFDSLPKDEVTADSISAYIGNISNSAVDLANVIERNIKQWKREHIEFFITHNVLKNRYKIFEIPRALIDIYTVASAKFKVILDQPTDSLIKKKILSLIETLMQLEKNLRVAENTHAGNILGIDPDNQDEMKRNFVKLLNSLGSSSEFEEFSSLVIILKHHKDDLIRFLIEEQ